MSTWLPLAVPLALLAVVALFGMVGCGLDADPIDNGGGEGDGGGDGNGPKPNPDLVSQWLLGEASGGIAADNVDGHPGTYTVIALQEQAQSPATPNPPVLTKGDAGLLAGEPGQTCILVDGGYVEVPFDAALNTPTFTAMVWCLPEYDLGETVNGQPVFRCVLASREGNGVQPAGFMIYSGPDLSNPSDTTIYWQAWVGDGTMAGPWTMLMGPAVNGDETTHLAISYDGATLLLYVNGTQAGPPAQTSTAFSPNTSKSLYIGMGAPDAIQPAYPFKGRLQDARYYKAAQSAAVIDDVVAAALTAP
jgi:hypothetical protein